MSVYNSVGIWPQRGIKKWGSNLRGKWRLKKKKKRLFKDGRNNMHIVGNYLVERGKLPAYRRQRGELPERCP